VTTRSPAAAENARIVLEYRDAFSSFEPGRYEPFLAEHPAYHAGMNHKMGRTAFHQNTGAGRVLYPHGALRQEDLRVIADGDWVAVLSEREAITNSGAHYENLYGMFYEVRGGFVQTQVELMDFRVSTALFDLTALGPELMGGGRPAVPSMAVDLEQLAAERAAGSAGAAAKATVVDYLRAFMTFEPECFEPFLGPEPSHQVGMSRRQGRSGFREIARIGRTLYPGAPADQRYHALLADGSSVAALVSMRALTNAGVEYENLYGMFFELDAGLITSMVELLDDRVAAAAFDLSALDG
jgi:ketosteroid isomerase-like protein